MDNFSLLKLFFFASLIVTAKSGICTSEPGLSLELTRTPRSSSPVYPQQRVMFTCITRESAIQVWRVDDYTVAGDTIEFLSSDPQGRIITRPSLYDSEIIATLTCVDQENLTLESTLSIIISPRPLTFNVTCINNGLRKRDNITIHVLDMPSQEINSSLQGASACPGDRINFTCTTYNSSIQAWQSDYFLGKGVQAEFLSLDQEGKVIIGSSANATLNSISIVNESIIINSTFSIIAPTDLRRILNVTCFNIGIGTKTTENVSLADSCSSDGSVTSQIPAINPSPDGPIVLESPNFVFSVVLITPVTAIIASLLCVTVTIIFITFLKRRENIIGRQNNLLLNNQRAKLLQKRNAHFGKEVYQEIREEMAPEWRRFGMAVGIDSNILDRIDQEDDSEYNCLRKVINEWVRKSTKELKRDDAAKAIITVKCAQQEHNSDAGMQDDSTSLAAGQEQEQSTAHPANEQEQPTINPGSADQEPEQSTLSPNDRGPQLELSAINGQSKVNASTLSWTSDNYQSVPTNQE